MATGTQVPSKLEVRALARRYGSVQALDGVDLAVCPGEFFGLLGPNGAGKSTLMNILSGYIRADSGSAAIDGTPLTTDDRSWRHRIGLVPQKVALYEDLSAKANLEVFGSLYGLARKPLRSRIEHVLEAVQLTERAGDKVKTFSGGMQRRLNIAAALIHEPELLLCDEPTVGVDPQSRNAIFEFLQAINRAGVTVLYSTHYMEEAERLCGRIAIIDTGRIIAIGSRTELLDRLPFEEQVSFPADERSAPLAVSIREHGQLKEVDGSWLFRPSGDFALSRLFHHLEDAGIPNRAVEVSRPTLEDLFLHLTGKHLRE